MRATTVTGIQRVQCGYIEGLLRDPVLRGNIRFAAFCTTTGEFFTLPIAEVSWLVRSLAEGAEEFASRRERVGMMLDPAGRQPLRARRGDAMLVTGSFWSFPGFMEAVGRLRSETRIAYVQVFYDLVPVRVPETCPTEEVRKFCGAIVRMLRSADGVLTISQYSAGELRLFCTRLGLNCPPVAVVPMGSQRQQRSDIEVANRADLPVEPHDFVLCVGTIEPRKNHLYLFHLWRRMLMRRGQHTPALVCAGRFGWYTEELRRHLEATANLDGRFVMLSEVSEAQLSALYAQCRFTIYPSVYEGWGLPVSESLAAGKLCVTSRVTAMPEAGGEWAHYIDPHNLEDGYDVVTRLLDDPELVRAAEREIRASYRPTSWEEASRGLWTGLEQVLRLHKDQTASVDSIPTLALAAGHAPPAIVRSASPLEIARFELARIGFATVLDGPDWHQIEEWGVWARGLTARLLFNCPDAASGRVLCYLRLSVPDHFGACRFHTVLNGTSLGAFEVSGVARTVVIPLAAGTTARLVLTLDKPGVTPVGTDPRQLGIGLHRIDLCASDDLAARLAYVERESFGYHSELPIAC